MLPEYGLLSLIDCDGVQSLFSLIPLPLGWSRYATPGETLLSKHKILNYPLDNSSVFLSGHGLKVMDLGFLASSVAG